VSWPSGFTPPSVLIRTDRSVYRETDAVQITVAAMADCRLTLLSIGPNGNVAQLFPNAAQSNPMLKQGQVITVPPVGSGVAIKPRGPNGMETIVGVCAPESAAPAAAPVVQQAQRDLAVVAQSVAAQTVSAGEPTVPASAAVYFVRP
jgi:hypothetical protein